MQRFFLLSLLCFVAASNAFVIPPPSTQLTTTTTTAPATTALWAKKKNAKPEKKQITDPLELLILYATPWRNPNSIFVYLFGLLYALGKWSEAHSGP